MTPEEILKKPYALTFFQNDGGYTAMILEFPGCFAEGATIEEAAVNMQSAAESWILACQDQGREIPEAFESLDPYGQRSLKKLVPLWYAISAIAEKREAAPHDWEMRGHHDFHCRRCPAKFKGDGMRLPQSADCPGAKRILPENIVRILDI